MRRRIARKILKRVHYKHTLVAGCEVWFIMPGTGHKRGTINRAALVMRIADWVPGTLEHPKTWGMLDRDTQTWLGGSFGPLTYYDYKITRIKARIIAVQLGWSPLRVIVQRYTPATRKLDDLETRCSGEEAMRRLEEGLTL
jgi:hypothetical protein